MVFDAIIDWLLQDELFKLDQFILNDIVLHELVPFILSLVENDRVTEMEYRGVIGLEIVVHETCVSDELSPQPTVAPVIVELETLNKLVLVVGVPLESFNDWHTTLISLNDVHGKIFYVVRAILQEQVGHNVDFLFVILVVIFTYVILSGQVEECVLWIFDDILLTFYKIIQRLNFLTSSCIWRCLIHKGEWVVHIKYSASLLLLDCFIAIFIIERLVLSEFGDT